jgi:hypothetical protein
VLDDPFFWQEADDFAPHGNDTGADLLADYRPWRRRTGGRRRGQAFPVGDVATCPGTAPALGLAVRNAPAGKAARCPDGAAIRSRRTA